MKQKIEITVPTQWSSVSLSTYRKLQKDIQDHLDNPQAVEHFILYRLTGLTPDILSSLDIETYDKIREDVYSFMNKTDFELQRIITIDGIEYGFEPNLSKMSYASYLDLTSYPSIELNDDWSDIMNILYRPVTKKWGALYEIEKYKGFEPWDTQKWNDVGMDVHFGCFFLFKNILKDLQLDTLRSLRKEMESLPNSESDLVKSGKVIKHLTSLQETIFSTLIK
jgi:hypothetical protein